MTNENSKAWTLARLDRLLEAYGANHKRWPDADREGLAVYLAGNAGARRRVEETAALDALLDKAALFGAKVDAGLVDRIAAAAAGQPQTMLAAQVVVPFKPRARPEARPGVVRTMRWREAGLLAATLLVGFYIGAAGIADRVLTGDGDSEFESALIVMPADASDAAEEDTL